MDLHERTCILRTYLALRSFLGTGRAGALTRPTLLAQARRPSLEG